MVELKERMIDGDKYYKEISGDSSESKPTSKICDGSVFIESDTGNVFLFNEKTGTWVEQFCLQG